MVLVRKARVALVDDHPLFRQGLAVVLRSELDLDVIGEAGDASHAVALVREQAIDLAILDILMPGTSGISLASAFFDIQPQCKVLALSVVDEPGLIADMLRAHAFGFALKTQPVSEILEAVRTVLAGLRYLPPCISRDTVELELERTSRDPLQRLTPREREVFELLIRGCTNDEVAARLFISRRTAETHRQRIIKKLSAHSIPQLQRIAARHGGLNP